MIIPPSGPAWHRGIVERLAAGLREAIGRAVDHRTLEGRATPPEGYNAEAIATQLISAALSKGLITAAAPPQFRSLSGGNTALEVSVATSAIAFVFKADMDPKLIREAHTLADLRDDWRLGRFCSRLPRIYAIHDAFPPYAYLMEHFDVHTYASIRQLFFGDPTTRPSTLEASRVADAAIDALREAYERSKDPRQQVRMMGDVYYSRIRSGLAEAAQHHTVFRSVPLTINGRRIPAWSESLEMLHREQMALQSIAAPFVTVVHGDPNPGNILLRRNGDPDVKFIDVKDWRTGDYLFDIAKLTHFLLHTGPIEDLGLMRITSREKGEEGLSIDYDMAVPDYVSGATSTILEKTAEIARSLGDEQWRARYELAMASNLLGVIPKRLDSVNVALGLYVMGMQHLDTFLGEFERLLAS